MDHKASIWTQCMGWRTEFSEKKTFTYHRMKCPLSARPQTKASQSMGTQNIHKNRRKANGSVDISGRQLKSTIPHMVSAGHV